MDHSGDKTDCATARLGQDYKPLIYVL